MAFKRLGSLMQLDTHADSENDTFSMSEQMERAKEQIEYYLSGLNLEKDKYFTNLMNQNDDRYIPASVFMDCQRIKQIGISIDDLVFACSKSHFLDVDIENQKIRPKTPFFNDIRRKFRTLRMSGFPTDASVDTIYDYLLANVFEPESIVPQLCRNDIGELVFNGTVHVLFFNEENAEQALQAELTYNNRKIYIETITKYESKKKKYEKKMEFKTSKEEK